MRVVAPATLLLAAALSGCIPPRVESPYVVDACPVPPHVAPYTVAASALDGSAADTTFQRAVLRSVLRYWEPDEDATMLKPQTPVEAAALLESRDTAIFVFDERRPRSGDRALLAVTLRRDGRVEPRLVRPSGRAGFDASLVAAVRRATLARETRRVATDSLPADLPRRWTSDSAVVLLEFGADPGSPPPVVRFARQATPATALPGNPVPSFPALRLMSGEEGEVLVTFAVEPSGRPDTTSVRVVSSTDPAFEDAVLRVLPRYRFRPATFECEPRRMWALMPFAFRIDKDTLPPPWRRGP